MREKKLIINSILYFFGSLGKGVASIVVVLMGSFYISPEEMGIYDLVISTITLLQPIAIFQINDGIYRWLLENQDEKENIIICGFRIAYRNMVIVNMLLFLMRNFINIKYKLLIICILNLNCIYPLLQQITRGLKNHRIFAISGIINGGSLLLISYILLKYFKLGISGFYIGQIISNVLGIVYLSWVQRINMIPHDGDKEIIKQYRKPMQKYSIMLVPNSINQWIMKALDKYCIMFFMTSYDNGIYTIAHRFPDVLIMLNSMFYSAWVEQSIVEYKSKDRDEYFSKIYDLYTRVIVSIVLIGIPITKYFIKIITGSAYQNAYQYVPFLYISVIFLGLSSFIGTGYLGTKKTEGIMWTSLIGSIVNTVINVSLMPFFGLQVAGISSLCAYFFMWLVRIKQTRKFFKISINWKMFTSLIVLAILFAIGVQFNNFYLDIIMEVVAVLISVILNKKMLIDFIVGIHCKIKKKNSIK